MLPGESAGRKTTRSVDKEARLLLPFPALHPHRRRRGWHFTRAVLAARNGFEDQRVSADIIAVQKQLGVEATGVLDAPTRSAIAAFTTSEGMQASDELSFSAFDRIVGRSPSAALVTRPGGRVARGEINENVPELADELMKQLGFSGRIASEEKKRFSDNYAP